MRAKLPAHRIILEFVTLMCEKSKLQSSSVFNFLSPTIFYFSVPHVTLSTPPFLSKNLCLRGTKFHGHKTTGSNIFAIKCSAGRNIRLQTLALPPSIRYFSECDFIQDWPHWSYRGCSARSVALRAMTELIKWSDNGEVVWTCQSAYFILEYSGWISY
jgi:hypothetical protein